MNSKIINANTLIHLPNIADNSVDIIFTDPPYNLSTKWTIINGKPEVVGLAKDFMNKWDGLKGSDLEKLFSHYYRILKYGGRVIMFGMDRQDMPFKYYACLSGFIEQQSLYWYYMCLSDDTEILTNNGWKKIDTIIPSDKVAEYDIVNENVVLELFNNE